MSEIEPSEYAKLDLDIRKILVTNRIHYKPANMDRLYIPRTQLGRGLNNVEEKAERILLMFNTFLKKRMYVCPRKKTIIENEMRHATQLGLIKEYLCAKYQLPPDFDHNLIKETQIKARKQRISEKSLHSILYKAEEDENVNLKASSAWLSKGNNPAQTEALYCSLQDRNMFLGRSDTCNHCNTSIKTVDHLATKCGRLLYINYVHRHDEVLRCIHLHFLIKYGFKKSKKMRTHKTSKYIENERAIIKTDSFIFTDVRINNNKPDLYIHDKLTNKITLVEVGITSQDNLKTVETEKYRKYDLLAKELGMMHKCEVEIIPFVMTWDGIVTKYHNIHVRKIGLDIKTKTYIQSIVLKKTLEAISFDYRRHNMLRGLKREVAIAEACEETAKNLELEVRSE